MTAMAKRYHLAIFPGAAAFLQAARECRARGLDLREAWTPFPVHGLDELLGIRRSRLPWVTLVAGALGAAGGLAFQYWASAEDYPLDVGGKPWDSFLAFVPVTFEMLVLLGGLASAAAFLLRSRLWPGRKEVLPDPAVSDDAFALLLEAGAAWTDEEIHALLRRHGAREIRIECRP